MARKKAFPTTHKKKNKVAVVGFATSSRDLAPYDDDDFEIWGCNALGKKLPKRTFDRIIDLHLYDGDHPTIRFDTRLKWYKDFAGPVYMQRPDPTLPNSLAFPLDDIVSQLAPYFPRKWVENRGYFTNTIGYMLAMAICEGFEEIHCYGVDMVADSEYLHQKANVEMFLALASGMGIKIFVPAVCALLTGVNLYAYEDEPGEGYLREDDLRAMLEETNVRHIESTAVFNTYDGVVQCIERLLVLMQQGQTIDEKFLRVMIEENDVTRTNASKEAQAYDGSIQTFHHLLAVIKGRKRGVEVNLLRPKSSADTDLKESTDSTNPEGKSR